MLLCSRMPKTWIGEQLPEPLASEYRSLGWLRRARMVFFARGHYIDHKRNYEETVALLRKIGASQSLAEWQMNDAEDYVREYEEHYGARGVRPFG